MENTTDNVSVGKGVAGGYYFAIPYSKENVAKINELSDFTKKVTEVFSDAKNLGFLVSDGFTIAEDRDSDDYTDINGEVIGTVTSSYFETETVTFGEVKADTLKVMYGDSCVSDENGLITAYHTAKEHPEHIYAFDGLLKDDRHWRVIAPKGQVTELGDQAIGVGNLVGRETTIKCKSDIVDGVTCTHVEYVGSTETVKGE